MEQEQEIRIRQLPVRLPEPEYDALKVFAFFNKVSMNDVMRSALTAHLAAHADNELDAIVNNAQSRYRAALDKLAQS